MSAPGHVEALRDAVAESRARRNGTEDDDPTPDASWVPVDLGPAVRGEVVKAEPSLLRREDGRALFYERAVNGVWSDSGEGKSMVAAAIVAQEITAGRHAVWVDFEDDETTIVERLVDIFGVDGAVIVERLHYLRPASPFGGRAVQVVAELVVTHDVALVVIDSQGEAFALEGIVEDRDLEVGTWLRRVARTLADLGPAIVIIDHSTKAKDNPLFPSGSKRKRAALTGAGYFLEAPTPLTREHGGRLRLTCAKDRHGHWRRGEIAAVVDFHVYPDGGTSVKVWPPLGADTGSPDQKLRILARAAIRATKAAEHPLSLRELLALMNVKGRDTDKRAAIDYAIGAGAIRAEPGPRRATLHTYIRDLDPEATP